MVKSTPINSEKDVKTAAKKPSTPSTQHSTRQQDISLLQTLQRGIMPANLRPADILQLHRIVGNRAVGALLRSTAQAKPVIQAKLVIGQPDDKYEQEADRIAEQVVAQINAPASSKPMQEQPEQRQALSGKSLQTKPVLQMQEAIQGGETSTNLESEINRAKGGGQPLDKSLQQSMGQAMGADFSRVRVHIDDQADQFNRSIQAKAFTTGQDIFFRHGAYSPGSRSGQELLAHELTHVVQQKGRKANENNQEKGGGFLDSQVGKSSLMIHRMPGGEEKKRPESVDGVKFFKKSENEGFYPLMAGNRWFKAIAEDFDLGKLHIHCIGNKVVVSMESKSTGAGAKSAHWEF